VRELSHWIYCYTLQMANGLQLRLKKAANRLHTKKTKFPLHMHRGNFTFAFVKQVYYKNRFKKDALAIV